MEKRILFVVDNLKIGGGIERVISTLSKFLSKNYKIFFLAFRDFKNLYPFEGRYYSLKENLKTFNPFLKFFKIYSLTRIKRILISIKTISPHLIISNMYYTDIFTILTKLLFRIKIPIVTVIHTNPKMRFKGKSWYIKFILKFLYSLKQVNKIITVSKEIQHIIKIDYGINEKKISNIYNGINIELINKLKDEPISDYNNIFYDENKFIFINVGRLVELKGQKYLIEAFAAVKDKLKNPKLLIIGEGPLRNKLIALIKDYQLENHVFLLGVRKNPYNLMAKSNIFILSSIYEGFPTVLLEALACGLPIISTNCKTGPFEILKKNEFGILVEAKNPKDLAENMLKLAHNKELLKKFSIKALERAKDYNIKKKVNQWIQVIENLFLN
ncbi:MAG: glycosyltransferase [Candidatus Hermodarchaeota archaeon]